ncbi:MAG: KxYKxGKxW signal peptide domain-containing protein [Puniceicoccales bacterium]|nr:KxYKxGKxW signal peptide domain-containing protein [Puniceicoccales bacterium]
MAGKSWVFASVCLLALPYLPVPWFLAFQRAVKMSRTC